MDIDTIPKHKMDLTPEFIVTACCKMFGIPEDEIKQPNRRQEYVVCRAFIAHFIRANSNLSVSRIGKFIARDHSNVTHLIQTIDIYKKMDILYNRFFVSLDDKFSGNTPIAVCPTCGRHNI